MAYFIHVIWYYIYIFITIQFICWQRKTRGMQIYWYGIKQNPIRVVRRLQVILYVILKIFTKVRAKTIIKLHQTCSSLHATNFKLRMTWFNAGMMTGDYVKEVMSREIYIQILFKLSQVHGIYTCTCWFQSRIFGHIYIKCLWCHVDLQIKIWQGKDIRWQCLRIVHITASLHIIKIINMW